MGRKFGRARNKSSVGRDVSTTGRYLSISGKIGGIPPLKHKQPRAGYLNARARKPVLKILDAKNLSRKKANRISTPTQLAKQPATAVFMGFSTFSKK